MSIFIYLREIYIFLLKNRFLQVLHDNWYKTKIKDKKKLLPRIFFIKKKNLDVFFVSHLY